MCIRDRRYDIRLPYFLSAVAGKLKLDRLILFFSSDPSAKLLKADSAPYVIYFLNQTYKVESNLSLPQSDLQSRLSRFLETLHETEPDVLCDMAQNYLTKWSTGDTRWLRRNFDAQFDEPVYELTPHTEDVFKFCLLYTSPSPRDRTRSRMPSSA